MDDLTWDDVHTGGVEDTSGNHADDDDDLQSREFDDDDSLELNRDKTGEDDDEVAEGAANKDEDANKVGDDDEGKGDDKSDADTDMSGIELYLSQFDIVGGMIQYEDGTEKHFDDLTPAEQADVLRELHGSTASSIEEKYGLDPNEIGLINHLRENNISVEQFIENEVGRRVNETIMSQGSAAIDFTTLTDDAVYTMFLQESSPEATPEQLAADLEKAKEMSNYTKLAESLRSQYTARQTAEVSKTIADQTADRNALIEEQRQEIVNAVVPMTDFAGIQLTDTIKNEVLDRVLQVDEDGDSTFMGEVFSNPENLFAAAFWYTYGPALVQQRDEYWKREKSAAYKRGKEDALGSSSGPTQRKTFVSGTDNQDPHKRKPVSQQVSDDDDWNSLNS